ncbi:MAG: lysophospholipid acyltransferase family protein [Fretibacterium sp.]|nr:lysophospholipid acyltransferase family protein [Fretibacterium sp.]
MTESPNVSTPRGGIVRVIRGLQAVTHPDWRGWAVASFLSGLLKIIRPRAKRIDANLRLVHPDWDEGRRRTLRREVYENLAWTVTEVLALQRNPEQALEWVTEVEGREVMESLFRDKRGAILMSGHFGNWELIGSWYGQTAEKHGRAFRIVYQEIHDRNIALLVNEYRERAGMPMMVKETSTLEMARMLREGDHIAILTDVSWSGGLRLPFMGQLCTNSAGPAVLSMLGNAPIVPAALYRQAPFHHTVRFLPPISVPREGKRDERLKQAVLNINHALETLIAPRPELWFWLHNRWK